MAFDARHDRPITPAKSPFGRPADRDGEISRWMGTDRASQVRAVLAAAGVKLTGPSTGRMMHGDLAADVLLEQDDLIRITAPAPQVGEAREMLERCVPAAGNVRFSAPISAGPCLIADTRVDGVAHLPGSLRRIGASFAQVLGGPLASESDTSEVPPLRERLRAAVAEAGWSGEGAVDTQEGHELHVTQGGARTTVQVTAGPGSVVVRRTLLDELPAGDAGRATAHQALACNAQLRGCRLAVTGGALVVEARLCADQIVGEWLAFTVRAVAAAAQHAGPVLALLAREPAVAAAYADMFLAGPPTQ
jgi:hypothetical protein